MAASCAALCASSLSTAPRISASAVYHKHPLNKSDFEAGESAFLREELEQLERVLTAVHAGRAEADARVSRLRLDLEGSRHSANHFRIRVEELTSEIERLRHAAAADATVRASLALGLSLLHGELEASEVETRLAREAEAYALGIASSYRSFAADAARSLKQMEDRVSGVGFRLEQRLERLCDAARRKMRQRALAAVLNSREWHCLAAALRGWWLACIADGWRELGVAVRHESFRQQETLRQLEGRWEAERQEAARAVQSVVTDAHLMRREREGAEAAAAEAADRLSRVVLGAAESAAQLTHAHAALEAALQRAEREATAAAAVTETLRVSEAARKRLETEGASLSSRLEQAEAELMSLRAAQEEWKIERDFLHQALQDERRLSMYRMQIEAELEEFRAEQALVHCELDNLHELAGTSSSEATKCVSSKHGIMGTP